MTRDTDRTKLLHIKCRTGYGHTFKVLTDERGEPSGVVCRGCGNTWPVDSDRHVIPATQQTEEETHD